MDFLRQGRVLIPPFMLLLTWWWMQHGDKPWTEGLIPKLDTAQLTLLIAFLGAAALPTGYIIGGLSFLMLRTGSWLFTRDWNFDVRMSKPAWQRLRTDFRAELPTTRDRFLAGTTFGLELEPALQAWIDRRWNAFYTSVNCVVAIA